jgi:ribosome biogenesis GTPase
MNLEELGFIGKVKDALELDEKEEKEIGRVLAEHKERYIVQTISGKFSAEILGNLRFTAKTREEFPAVGDWVRLLIIDENNAVIKEVLPRTSVLERKAAARVGEKQIIAANIDFGLIVQSVGHDFNLNRLERYLTICHSAGITPLVLLTKSDLADKQHIDELVGEINERVKGIKVIPISSVTKSGFAELNKEMEPYYSYCLLGSSGVGKTTIINQLLGEDVLHTAELSQSTNKGRHTTSHRELFILPNKSIVIDTPGMRELGISDDNLGIDTTYEEIILLAENCRFNDCTHTNETDCAVLKALEDGKLSRELYENFQKLLREQSRYSSSVQEKRKKSRELGKLYKRILDEKQKNKYSGD